MFTIVIIVITIRLGVLAAFGNGNLLVLHVSLFHVWPRDGGKDDGPLPVRVVWVTKCSRTAIIRVERGFRWPGLKGEITGKPVYR